MTKIVSFTDRALKHIASSFVDSPAGTAGIRFGLRNAGCSGFAYTFDFAAGPKDGEMAYEIQGIKVFVKDADLSSIRGTEIDLVQQGINSVLQFNNPNVANTCGCGESVQFKSSGE